MIRKSFALGVVVLSLTGCQSPDDPALPRVDIPPVVNPQPTESPRSSPTPVPSSTPAPSPSVTPTPTPTATVPVTKPLALVYGGPGVLTGRDDTWERAVFVAEAAGFEVITVTEKVPTATLNRASVWVQPGGPNLYADSHMNRNGMYEQVRDFVRRGGGYVGFCGGAFSAVNNLGLIPGEAWNYNEYVGKIPVQWLGRTRYLHWEYGPYIVLSGKTTEVVATYEDGTVAAARANFGKGRVFISGPHPEASAYWPPTRDPDGIDTDLATGMIREVARVPDAP